VVHHDVEQLLLAKLVRKRRKVSSRKKTSDDALKRAQQYRLEQERVEGGRDVLNLLLLRGRAPIEWRRIRI
jgi:hypothetical protein